MDIPVPQALEDSNPPPTHLPIGTSVMYEPSPGYMFGGVVESEPFLCGQTWCVTLGGMAPEYGQFKGDLSADPTRVKAAAVPNCHTELTQ